MVTRKSNKMTRSVPKTPKQKTTAPIFCYVRAASIEDAQVAAFDSDYVTDYPSDADAFPICDDPQGMRLYEITITARPIEGPKPKARKSKVSQRIRTLSAIYFPDHPVS